VKQAERSLAEEIIYVTTTSEVETLVQFNAVELHDGDFTFAAMGAPRLGDFRLIDPDEGLPFASRVWLMARSALKEELEELSLMSFVKTTGGKGLQWSLPVKPIYGWDVIEAFRDDCRGTALRSARAREIRGDGMSKAKRRGKIFIDRFRNAKGATAVLPFSHAHAPDFPSRCRFHGEISGVSSPAELDVRTVPKLVCHSPKGSVGGSPRHEQNASSRSARCMQDASSDASLRSSVCGSDANRKAEIRCPGGFGMQVASAALLRDTTKPWMQSKSVWQGCAHFPYCVLHVCVPHAEVVRARNAIGPGTGERAARREQRPEGARSGMHRGAVAVGLRTGLPGVCARRPWHIPRIAGRVRLRASPRAAALLRCPLPARCHAGNAGHH